MQLHFDPGLIMHEHRGEYFIYSPANHVRAVVNGYSHYLIELILQAEGQIEPGKIIQSFTDRYNVTLTPEQVYEQVERLTKMGLFFNSAQELEAIKREIAEKNKITDRVPRTAYLLLTFRCNFDCSYCYLRDTNKNAGEMSTAEWKTAIRLLRDLGVERFAITGGEATLRTDLVEILQECKSVGAKVSLLTNGSLLKTLFDQIDPLLDSVVLSLDSFDEKINTLNRSNFGFTDILDVIELYAQKSPDKLQVRAVITKHNFHEMNDFSQRLNEQYKIKTIRTLVNPIRPEEVDLVPDMTGNLAIDPDRIESLSYAMKYRKCGACYDVMALNPVGDIFPCQAVMNPEFKITNIFRENWFAEFLSSSVRKQFTELCVDKLEKCKDCSYRYLCGACCPAIGYNIYGSLDKHVPFFCDYLKERAKDTLFYAKAVWQEV